MSDRGDLSATLPASSNDDGGDESSARGRVGRYELHKRLGAGAMGVVYEAYDPQLDRKVAIKVVHPRRAMDPTGADRLLREARALARLKHPNVIAVHDAGWADGQLFVAMELIEGQSLGAWLATPRPWREALSILTDAGRGLAAAHAAGILHRDFKPDNVLVASDGRVCVGDFGLAELGATAESAAPSATTSSSDPKLTTTGALIGTPAYMAAEQHRGQTVDARADQFAFCVSLWEALYGERPFDAGNATGLAGLHALAAEVIAGRIKPPPRGSSVPGWLEQAVRRGLRVDPADRYASMDDLLRALDPAPRRRRTLALAGALLGLAAAGAVAFAVTREDAEPAAPMVPPNEPPPATASDRTIVADVPLTPLMAVSPDGARVLFLGNDRVTVIETSDGTRSVLPLPSTPRSLGAYFATPSRIVLSLYDFDTQTGSFATWELPGKELVPGEPMPAPAFAVGHAPSGELVAVLGPSWADRELALLQDTGWRSVAKIGGSEFGQLSPDGTHAALVRPQPAAILTVELSTGSITEHPATTAPFGVLWLDGDHLLLGDQLSGRLTELDRITGALRERHMQTGVAMIRPLYAHGRRVIAVTTTRPQRSHLLELVPTDASHTELPPTVDPIGWTASGELIARDRDTALMSAWTARGDELRTLGTAERRLLDTSVAGDLLLAIEHGDTCSLTGRSTVDGAIRWTQPIPCRARVACAADVVAPCYVVSVEATSSIGRIDLDSGVVTRTGLLGNTPSGPVALTPDGTSLVFATEHQLRRVPPDGRDDELLVEIPGHSILGVTYARSGRIYVVTAHLNTGERMLYAVDGAKLTVLWSSARSELSLPRVAPDGHAISFVEAGFQQDLVELTLPR